MIVVDEKTLEAVGVEEKPSKYPPGFGKPVSDFKGMRVRISEDSGNYGDASGHYVLRWETLGANRDRARTGEMPDPVMLKVVKIK